MIAVRLRLVCLTILAASVVGCGRAPKSSAALVHAGKPATGTVAEPARDDAAIRRACERGLDFLAGRARDGIVSVKGTPHVGVTALALLAMMERPVGPRERDQAVVDAGMAFLAKSLDAEGHVSSGASSVYETSVVAMALAASKKPVHLEDLEKAAKHLRSVQHVDRAKPGYGGFGASVEDDVTDLTMTYSALLAVEAAGGAKDDAFLEAARTYLQRCQNRKESETQGEPRQWSSPDGDPVARGNDGGGFSAPGWSKAGYEPGEHDAKVPRSYGSATAALLHAYRIVGVPEDDGRVKAALAWIANHWSVAENPGMPDAFPEKQKRDGLFFCYATTARALSSMKIDRLRTKAGRDIDWRVELTAALLAAQKPDGSWQSDDVLWMESVPTVATSFAVIALESCMR